MITVIFVLEILKNDINNRCVWYFLIPLNILEVFNGYSLVGGVVITWIIVILLAIKKLNELIISIMSLVFLIPIPAIYLQIRNIFFTDKVVLDEALVVTYKQVPKVIIFIAVINILLLVYKKISKKYILTQKMYYNNIRQS
jgi:hypothetical protein